MKKQSLILGAAIAATLASGVALADMSVNAAATSNYLWRGVTQSSDTASVSGGVDWSDASGIYAGVWVGSLVAGQETDFYAGYSGEAGDLGYDVGFITYAYTITPNSNFTEVYANGSFENFSFGLASTTSSAGGNAGGAFDKGDLYVNAGVDFAAGPFDANFYVGSYMFDNDSAATPLDYTHYGISLSKGEVSVNIDKNDIDGSAASAEDNVRIIATWSKAWDI